MSYIYRGSNVTSIDRGTLSSVDRAFIVMINNACAKSSSVTSSKIGNVDTKR